MQWEEVEKKWALLSALKSENGCRNEMVLNVGEEENLIEWIVGPI